MSKYIFFILLCLSLKEQSNSHLVEENLIYPLYQKHKKKIPCYSEMLLLLKLASCDPLVVQQLLELLKKLHICWLKPPETCWLTTDTAAAAADEKNTVQVKSSLQSSAVTSLRSSVVKHQLEQQRSFFLRPPCTNLNPESGTISWLFWIQGGEWRTTVHVRNKALSDLKMMHVSRHSSSVRNHEVTATAPRLWERLCVWAGGGELYIPHCCCCGSNKRLQQLLIGTGDTVTPPPPHLQTHTHAHRTTDSCQNTSSTNRKSSPDWLQQHWDCVWLEVCCFIFVLDLLHRC